MAYKIFNKTYQPILLIGGKRIAKRSFIIVQKITTQIKNIEQKGLITVRKL